MNIETIKIYISQLCPTLNVSRTAPSLSSAFLWAQLLTNVAFSSLEDDFFLPQHLTFCTHTAGTGTGLAFSLSSKSFVFCLCTLFTVLQSVVSWLSCFSIAVRRHHNQGNLQKSLLGPVVSDGKSMTIIVRSVAAGRHIWYWSSC